MSIIELKNLIAAKLGIDISIICAEQFNVRFHYHGHTYRVSIMDLSVEKVDGTTDSDAQQLEKLLRGEQWDGTGLPPVGTICKMRDDENKWVDVEIIANHKGFAHGWRDSTEETYYSNKHCEFRPLSTERDKGILQMFSIIDSSDDGSIYLAENLYDAIVAGKIDGLGKVG